MDPDDYIDPDWYSGGRIHNWKNYSNGQLERIWPDFTDEQKLIVASLLQQIANEEHWE